MPTPTNSGIPTLPDPANGEAYAESYFQALFTKQWGSAAGAAYAAYNKANPQNTPYVNAQYFLDLVVAQGLDNAIQTAISTSGTALGAIPGAAAQGARNAARDLNPLTGINAIGDFFNRLTKSNTWIRVAEVLLGLGLIVVGLAKIASGSPVGKAALKAGKAAAIL